MEVKDLIAQLATMDPTAEVHFSYNYGDHGRTMVAPEVTRVEAKRIVHSDYHDMPRIAEQGDRGARFVLVLS